VFTILDRYIAKRLLDHLFLGIVVFTLVLFFSDALLDFMRHLQHYGIAWDISLTLVGLQVPRIVAMVIPMSALLSTLLVSK
jgi:lipopolysaccharide export LptBFGC system permease protein LptF